MSTIQKFALAWRAAFTRTPSTQLSVYPRIVVDMGPKEQSEVRTTLETELQGLGPLLRRFEEKFRIKLSLEPRIDGSALVNPFDSSLVVADGVRERSSVREDRIAAGSPEEAAAHGLAAFLDVTRGHAAPRDDIDYSKDGLNRIGNTFLSVQQDGAVVSSVGPNSLMDLKSSTAQLWAVDPLFWATLHGTEQKVRNAFTTQYTARYHSPQMVRALLEAQLEWLLANPSELRNLNDPEARLTAQKRALKEQFFPALQAQYEAKKALINADHVPKIDDITADLDRDIPDIPTDIIAHHDDYKILGIYVPTEQLAQIPAAGDSVYVAIETRKYVPVEHSSESTSTPRATSTRLEKIPVTLLAEKTDAVFSGLNGSLTLAPCIHNEVGDKAQRVKLNLFVQMTSASNPNDGFHPSGAAGALFENEGGFVAVGHKVYAVVAKDVIDPLVTTVQASLEGTNFKPSEITPNWIIGHLVDKGLITYVDSSKLKEVIADANANDALISELSYEAKKPKVVFSQPGGRSRPQGEVLVA